MMEKKIEIRNERIQALERTIQVFCLFNYRSNQLKLLKNMIGKNQLNLDIYKIIKNFHPKLKNWNQKQNEDQVSPKEKVVLLNHCEEVLIMKHKFILTSIRFCNIKYLLKCNHKSIRCFTIRSI